jgi:hypothetical protein
MTIYRMIGLTVIVAVATPIAIVAITHHTPRTEDWYLANPAAIKAKLKACDEPDVPPFDQECIAAGDAKIKSDFREFQTELEKKLAPAR